MDREILKDFALLNVDYYGSKRTFARTIGVDKKTIDRWIDMSVARLDVESIEKIARHRNEKPEQTIAWLEGRTGKESPLLTQVRQANLDELVKVFSLSYELIQKRLENEEFPLVQVGASSCNLFVDKEKEGCMSESGERIPIGSKRHLKLKAILIESLRIEGVNLGDHEAIAIALGYKPGTQRFTSALVMLHWLLISTEQTIKRLRAYHVEALAQFCHRLERFEEFPVFRAICRTEQRYEGDTDRLLADINCENGATVGS
jgi:ribosomal protein S13